MDVCAECCAIFINFPRVITITILLHLAGIQTQAQAPLAQANKSVLALLVHITHNEGYARIPKDARGLDSTLI